MTARPYMVIPAVKRMQPLRPAPAHFNLDKAGGLRVAKPPIVALENKQHPQKG